jgi:F-type H+-transporting ATPase subunit a
MAEQAHTEQAHAVEEHAQSIFYGPVNRLWDAVAGWTGIEDRFGATDVPEHVVMALVVLAVVCVLVVPLRARLRRDDPGWLQQLAEVVVQSLSNLLDDVIGEGAARRYLPMIGAFAVFIFLSNLAGQFFFLQPPTQSTNTTFALSITACLYYHFQGVRHHGFGYLKQFLGPVPWLIPLMLPLEIVTHVARVFSLGIRLFGNIFGEHTAASIFSGLVPFLLPLPLMALGLFASFVQMFIFVMLTTIYIAGAEAEAH